MDLQQILDVNKINFAALCGYGAKNGQTGSEIENFSNIAKKQTN